MIVDFLIRTLFRLLGNTYTRQRNIPYLFGVSTTPHEKRKKRWERALARLYKDKDLLDFLFYQAESDKENIFRGKIRADLSRGARLRTLFLVHSAHKAYLRQGGRAKEGADAKASNVEEMQRLDKAYKEAVDIGLDG